ncbi:MAG: filamentous hemagglutinin N-terminal domain-containing protein [Cyanobacteria bacterium P01_A01_bin.135]
MLMRLLSLVLVSGMGVLPAATALAQNAIVPDDTLGGERSLVLRDSDELQADVILGGARRGQNLFHSFEDFNVAQGREAVFFSPLGLTSIFSRVTGPRPSRILGTLGIIGDAAPDLFLINPNGILFGPESIVVLPGALNATTADAIQFGERGFFSAANPDLPSPLLTVAPSAYWFTPSAATTPITVQSTFVGSTQGGDVTLLGGDITIDGGFIGTTGGAIQIAAVAEPGVVERTPQGRLLLPPGLQRSDVTITGGDLLALGGDIHIQADQMVLAAGDVSAIASESVSEPAPEAAITIEARRLDLREGAAIDVTTFGSADAGDIFIRAAEAVTLLSGASLVNEAMADGSGGDIGIQTERLSLNGQGSEAEFGAQISVSTAGTGSGGGLTILATDAVTLDDGQVFTTTRGAGDAGRLLLETQRLSLANGSVLSANTFADGDAGDIVVRATESTSVVGGLTGRRLSSSITSQTAPPLPGSLGNGGDIFLETGTLTLRAGGQISTGSLAATGDAGDLTVRATEVDIAGFESTALGITDSSLRTLVASTDASARGGSLTVEADRIRLQDGGTIDAAVQTNSRGIAGDIQVRARESIEIDGLTGPLNLEGGLLPARIQADVKAGATGTGGQIRVEAGRLALTNGGQILAGTFGTGDAGDLVVRADEVSLSGANQQGTASLIATAIAPGAVGAGGNISIRTETLQVLDGSQLLTNAAGVGDAGDITISASGHAVFAARGAQQPGGDAFSRVEATGVGRGGDIRITTPVLRVEDGAQIAASTQGQGDAGQVTLNTGELSLSGTTANGFRSAIFSSVDPGAMGDGDSIIITGNTLSISNGAEIAVSTSAQGDAGDITITAADRITLSNGFLISGATEAATGAGGNINLRASDIRLFDNSDILAFVRRGSEGGGNITLTADSILAFDDSDILAFAADGQGGNITFNTPAFFGENFNPATLAAPPSTLNGNQRVDINATGRVNGAIALPDVSFIQNSLAELPEGILNTESLIASSCVVRNEDGSSTFVVTGAAGLPERPGTAIAVYEAGEVQTIPVAPQDWQPGDAIVEPQGLYRLPNGELLLSHGCQ